MAKLTPIANLSLKKTAGLRITRRFAITFVIVCIVISSPILIFTNPVPVVATAAHPTDPTNSIGSAPSTISQDGGGDFTTQAALGAVSARPTNNIVNTNSFYDVVFVTGKAGVIKFIQVTFPVGTVVPTSAVFNEAEGIGPGFISDVTGRTITYAINNAVNVPIGTKIRLEFSNINNPLNPSTNYKVAVTTRNAVNGIIDGPTQSTAFTIKQIGTNAIANNAVTTPKIASDSIVPSVHQQLGSSTEVDPGTTGQASASCPGGEQVVGGGYSIESVDVMIPVAEFKSTNNWIVNMHNPDSVAHSYFAIAECMPALP